MALRMLTGAPPPAAFRSLLCVLLLCTAWPSLTCGQTASLRFERFTVEDGLAQQPVHEVLQDREGILWIGTTDGLNRYDGYRFKSYRPSLEATSISHGDVRALHQGPDGALWIGTLGGGLNRLDRESETFFHYPHDPNDPRSLSHDRVSALAEDASGRLWIGTDGGGLDRWDSATESFAHYRHDPADPASLSHDHVSVLGLDASGRLWIGTLGGGLNRFDEEQGTFVRYRHGHADAGSLSSDHVQALYPEPSGVLWIGTDNGLSKLDPGNETFVSYRHDTENAASLSDNRIRAVFGDAGGTLWVGTAAHGLDRFDPATETFLHDRHSRSDLHSLSDDGISEIYQDRSGLLWIGTLVGLNKLNPLAQAFGHVRPAAGSPHRLSGHRVRAIYEDRSGILWVGTPNGVDGLGRSTGNHVYLSRGPAGEGLSDDHVSAVHEDHTGALWFGTVFGGLNRLDRTARADAGPFVHYRHDPTDPASLSSDDILFIHEDSSRRLWIGTWGAGLNRFERATGTFTRFRHDPADPESLSDDHVLCVHESPTGTLWLGAWSDGLDEFDPATEKSTRHPFALSAQGGRSRDRVHVIHGDGSGALWLGTAANGLLRYDPAAGTWRRWTTSDGLANNLVYGILPDDRRRLWISTANGLSRFDVPTEIFRSYDVTDGLQGNEFGLHSSFRSAGGELFFGGNNGFNAFFPKTIRDNLHVPPVVLSAFKIFNREVDPRAMSPGGNELEIPFQDNMISFEVAALDFSAPEKNCYAYSLEGFSDSWIELGTRREVTLTNLNPGSYTLHVRGANNHGVWSERGLSIPFRVTPPWWRTFWFRAAAVLSLAGLGFAAYRARIRAIRTRNLALQAEITRRNQVEVERERLIAELEAKNQELERFSYTVSHDLKSPLVTIKGFLGLLKQDSRAGDGERVEQDIAMIDSAVATMHRLLEELLELSRVGHLTNPSGPVDLGEAAREVAGLLAGSLAERGAELEISSGLPVVAGDPVRILGLVQNLVENAVKFMGDQEAPRVEIGARRDGDETVCYVRDNGMGIDPADLDRVFGLFDRLHPEIEGTGLGLALARRIVEVHGGRLWVESEGIGRGSTFCFTLPLA